MGGRLYNLHIFDHKIKHNKKILIKAIKEDREFPFFKSLKPMTTSLTSLVRPSLPLFLSYSQSFLKDRAIRRRKACKIP